MKWNFQLGYGQKVHVESAMDLLDAIEALVDMCLETSNVFAIIKHGHNFCQLLLDADNDMHIETTLGDLATHSGFDESVPEFEFLQANFLPASWHARAKMTANAMTRAWVDAGTITFPAELEVQIHANTVASVDEMPPPQTEGASTIGFCFGADRPIRTFIDEIAAALDSDARSLDEIHNALQHLVEADYGPLNRIEDWVGADIVVELGTKGPAGQPWNVRFNRRAEAASADASLPLSPEGG